jgi:hypothetical protein
MRYARQTYIVSLLSCSILSNCNISAQETNHDNIIAKIQVDSAGIITFCENIHHQTKEGNKDTQKTLLIGSKTANWDIKPIPGYKISPVSSLKNTEAGEPNLTVYSSGDNFSAYNPATFELNVTVSVQNNGESDASEFLIDFHLSEDTTLSHLDRWLGGYLYLPELTAGYFATGSISFNLHYVTVPPGTYYILAYLDAYNNVDESNEFDNSFCLTPTLHYAGIEGVNLGPRYGNNSFRYYADHELNVSLDLHNNGDSDAGEFYIGYYLSTDSVISVSDILISKMYISKLESLYSLSTGTSVDLDTLFIEADHYYVGAIYDYLNQVEETYESDNIVYFTPPIAYCPYPEKPVVTGNKSFCSGTIETYSATSTYASYYEWTVPYFWTINSGQGTSSITVTTGNNSGKVSVKPSNNCYTGQEGYINVNVLKVPGTASIAGNTSVCEESEQLYTVTSQGATDYLWAVPADWNIITGQGSKSISVNIGKDDGNICITPSNICGTGTEKCTHIISNPLPGIATLLGDSIVCRGISVEYTALASKSVTYNWTVPPGSIISSGQGASTIQMTMGEESGEVCATPANNCGGGDQICMHVTVSFLPAQANIEGKTISCKGVVETYIASSINSETFTWNVPEGWTIVSGQGNDSLHVIVGNGSGEICVIPSNSHGAGIIACHYVIVNRPPEQPGAISGETSPTVNLSYTYTVDPISNADNYIWNVTGGNLNSVLNNALVTWIGPGVQQISLKLDNECGESELTILDVNVIETINSNIDNTFGKIMIYPNPISDYIQVVLMEDITLNCKIQLYNLSGDLVLYKDLDLVGQNSIISIDISNFQSGVYVLKVFNENNIIIKKISKVK